VLPYQNYSGLIKEAKADTVEVPLQGGGWATVPRKGFSQVESWRNMKRGAIGGGALGAVGGGIFGAISNPESRLKGAVVGASSAGVGGALGGGSGGYLGSRMGSKMRPGKFSSADRKALSSLPNFLKYSKKEVEQMRKKAFVIPHINPFPHYNLSGGRDPATGEQQGGLSVDPATWLGYSKPMTKNPMISTSQGGFYPTYGWSLLGPNIGWGYHQDVPGMTKKRKLIEKQRAQRLG
jgi:hypothetical protein